MGCKPWGAVHASRPPRPSPSSRHTGGAGRRWSTGDRQTMDRLGVMPTFASANISAGNVTCKGPDAEGRATCQQSQGGAVVFVQLTKAAGSWVVTQASGAG